MSRTIRIRVIVAFAMLPFCAWAKLMAQQPKPQADEMSRMADDLKHIQLQLDRIEKVIGNITPSDNAVTVDISGNYMVGQKNAPVTLVEFADYQCPYCRQFHTKVLEKLQRDFIATGKVRFIAFDLPLNIHTEAFKAAEAALCAGDQSKFWEMQDALITHSENLDNELILEYANRLGLGKNSFGACLDSERYAAKVKADVDLAGDLDVVSTPTFILGRSHGKEVEGIKLVGILSYPRLQTLIQHLLE